MSKLNELIQELCPNGVEYRKISSFTKVLRGKRLTKDKLSEENSIPVYHGGIEPLGYYGKANRPANMVMIINVGASAGTVAYSDKEFWSSDGCFCIDKNEEMDDRYLYHYLKNNEYYFMSKVRKAGIPTLDNFIVEEFKIPVPPLEVQREIVRILDSFTLLTAELAAELTARKKQYEYYRDSLLGRKTVETEEVFLEDIATYSKERTPANEVDEYSYVGVDNLLQEKRGKTVSSHVPTDGNLTKYYPGDVLIGNIRPYLRKIWFADNTGGTNGDVLVIHVTSDKVLPQYLYCNLSSERFFEYDTAKSKGAKMPRGDKDAVMKYNLLLPPIATQKRIVDVLNNFEKICNDLNIGLPAEIEARQKQYEFYRDKLLSFKQL